MELYIENTILSVLNQNYPNLEFIIVDGGSTDNTINIVNKYSEQIQKIICEPDHGMYDAINKGFSHSTGEIIAWLNADDRYFPWTLKTVGAIFQTYNHVNWISGTSAYIDENDFLISIYPHSGSKNRKSVKEGWCREGIYGYLQQEGMFFRKSLYEVSGGLNRQLKYAGDFDLWMRFANFEELFFVNVPLSAFMKREQSLSSAGKEKYLAEIDSLLEKKKTYPSLMWRLLSKKKIRHLISVFIIQKTPLIVYSEVNHKFIIKRIFRSVSNQTLSSLNIAYQFRLF